MLSLVPFSYIIAIPHLGIMSLHTSGSEYVSGSYNDQLAALSSKKGGSAVTNSRYKSLALQVLISPYPTWLLRHL